MKGVTIRPATDDEAKICVGQWLRLVTRVPKSEDDGLKWAAFGRGQVNTSELRPLLLGFIASIAYSSARLDVAVLDGDDEPLGFVCWSPGELHYVHVTGQARRKGLGTTLFRHAIAGPYTPTFMTDSGRALEQHALRIIAAEQAAAT